MGEEAMMTSRAIRTLATGQALLLCLALAGCVTIELPGGRPGPLLETVVEGRGSAKIALVELEGVISEEDPSAPFGVSGRESAVARIRAQLDKASRDRAVKAVVLRIQSPGGTATASDILYREVLRFKEKTGVPVVAALMGIATSGAYYTAMAADTVLAYPTTVTGSIGVIFAGVNVSGLMEKIGVMDQTFTSGSYKDAGSSLRPMAPEEREMIQSVLDDLYRRFQEVVATGRPTLGAERVAELADGRIYSAPQAHAAGLIDGISDLPGAIEEARRRAGLEKARVVSYHRRREWRENLYTRPSAPATPLLDAAALLGVLRTPSFLYLWRPALQ
jgi:protease-4